jgi:hypothetical protein
VAHGTFDVVPRPPGTNIVGSRWVYKLKLDSAGRVLKYKAQLVAKGFTQTEGLNYEATFAPVARLDSLRFALAIGALYGFTWQQLDYNSAYLNGDLKHEVFMAPIPGFPVADGCVLRLCRSLYGLKQAGRECNKVFHRVATDAGFRQCPKEPCVYARQPTPLSSDANLTILVVYVDDLAIGARRKEDQESAITDLCARFKATRGGALNWMLGLCIEQSVVNGSPHIRISQRAYVEALQKRFGFARDKCKRKTTPIVAAQDRLVPRDVAKEGEATPAERHEFASLLGALNWLGQCTRPDLCYALSKLAQFTQQPTQSHIRLLKGVLRYVVGTIGYGIEYGGKQPGHGVKKILAHSNSDFAAASNPSAKSILGYVVFINGGAVSWRSKLQSLTALSTAEAEYVALCEAAREVKFLANVVQFLGLSHSFGAPIIMGDNKAAHKIANNPAFHSWTKHFDVKVHFVRELVARKEIVLHQVATADNAADVLTKQSDQKRFAKSVCQLLIVNRRASAPEA